MSTSTYYIQVLIFNSDLTSSRWSQLQFTVAANNTIHGEIQYIGPAVKLTGKLIPGMGGGPDRYEFDQDGIPVGTGITIRLSSYPSFGFQLPIAGVASINRSTPFFVLGSLSPGAPP